jgi:hypothetical protein
VKRRGVAANATAPLSRYRGKTGEDVGVVIPAVLVVLKTHIKIERGKDGKTTVMIEIKPTQEALLKPLVLKLFGFLSSHSPGAS